MIFYAVVIFTITQAILSSTQVSIDDLKRFADANNILGANLYPRLINGNSENVFFCPASLMTSLGMMLYGARGDTEEELYTVLGYKKAGLPNEKIPQTYHYYFTEMLPENNPNQVNYTLSCADEVLITNKAPLNPMYQNNVQSLYEATIKNVDLTSNPQKVVSDINSFVNKQTYGKINGILNSFSPSSTSLLIDAVFFKGKWETPFSSESLPQPFFSQSDGKTVSYMQVFSSFPYTETAEYQSLLLPYIGGNIGLLVILPRQLNGLSHLESSLTSDMIPKVVSLLKTSDVFVRIPKFQFQYNRDFSNDFKALGVKRAYEGPADFSAMTSSSNLIVSETLHKAALEVDVGDQGTRVLNNFTPNSAPIQFSADHPFLFAVVDRRINLVLFLGRVIKI